MAIGCVAMVLGCQSRNQVRSADLIVEEQTDSVAAGYSSYQVTFTVDAPVDGPEALVDSVMLFLNKQLYEVCEGCAHFEDGVVTFSEKEVFTDDGERLLGRYMEKYRPIIEDSLWGVYGLTLKMETQTEKYVTYGVEHFHCGASCGSEKYYYTFDKRDGHLIKEIISHDNLVRFFKDYPKYSVVDDFMWEFTPEYDFDHTDMGLLGDHFSLVISECINHYFSIDVPYAPISPYLSPEAQALVKQE